MGDKLNRLITGSGGGGKSGGGAHTPVNDPDSLQSTSIARGIDLICEGPIVGLVNGRQSVYVDGTPLLASDNTENFKGFKIIERVGTQDQSAIPNVPTSESEVAVGLEVTVAGGPLIQAINDVYADLIRVKLGFPSLTDVNVSNGDTHGTEVKLLMDIRENTGNWESTYFGTIQEALTYDGVNGWYYNATDSKRFHFSVLIGRPWYDENTPASSFVGVRLEYRRHDDPTWVTIKEVYIDAATFDRYYNDPTLLTAEHVLPEYWMPPTVDRWYIRAVKTGGNGSVEGISGYSFVPDPVIVISGKTSSKYEKSFTIPLRPGTGPWSVRITRQTADSDRPTLQNESWFSSYTLVKTEKLTYPNSALVYFEIDAAQFSKIPVRGYDMKLKIIKIPANYDPVTRQYTGNWDGTFVVAWSNNPAWCFYDLVTNERYGLGELIDSALVDKWFLYSIGRYCDELVPTGVIDNGVTKYEPRFVLNCFIQTRAEAYKVVGNLASAFRGMAYWAAGNVVCVQDSPSDPVMLFSAANVIGGSFNYTSSSKKARHTAVLVKWNDPELLYKQVIEMVEDEVGIARYGFNSVEVTAFGCTSRSQARRFGLWVLYTEQYETEVVIFQTSFEGVYIRPGNIIQVSDPNRAGLRMGGRVAAGSTVSTVVIDSPFVIEALKVYNLACILPTGVIEERLITNVPGSSSSITLSVPLSGAPTPDSMYLISSTDITPREYRVLGISEPSKNVLEIVALEYFSGKYGMVELGLVLTPPGDSVLPGLGSVLAVTQLNAVQETYTVQPNVVNYRIAVSWVASSTPNVIGYRVEYRQTNGNWVVLNESTKMSAVNIDNVMPGDYAVRVRAINVIQVFSPWTEDTVTVSNIMGIPPDIQNLAVDTVWVGPDCAITWDSIIGVLYPLTVHRRYRVDVYEGATFLRTDYVDQPRYTYTFGKNYDDHTSVPDPTVRFRVRGENWGGLLSVNPAVLDAVNAVPPTPVAVASYEERDCRLTWPVVADPDFLETVVEIWDNGYTTLLNHFHADSNSLVYTYVQNELDYAGHANPWDIFFRIKHFDKFGQASQQNLTVRNDEPLIPTNVAVLAGFQQVLVSWSLPTDPDWDVIEIYRSLTNDRDTATLIGSCRAIMFLDAPLTSMVQVFYWVRAVDTSGNPSAFDRSRYAGHDVTPYRIDGSDDIIPGSYPIDPGTLDLETIDIVSTLPDAMTYPLLSMVLLTTDHKLYRNVTNPSAPPARIWSLAVDGADIEANTITGNKIIAGEISGGHVAADAITVRHLRVQDSNNMVRNSEVRDGITDGWSLDAGVSAVPYTEPSVPAGCPAGHCIRLPGVAGSKLASQYDSTTWNWIPVEPGEELLLFARVATDASFDVAGTVGIRAIFADTARTTFSYAGAVLAGTALPWQRVELQVTAPAGRHYVAFFAEASAGLAGYAFITDLRARRAVGGSLIVDGAILATHLTTGTAVISVTAQIANAIITQAKISGKLTANIIDTGTLDAEISIGAGRVQISAINDEINVFDNQAVPVRRVELGKLGALNTDYGLKLYDKDGNTTFEASDTLKQKYMKLDSLEVIKARGPYKYPFSDITPAPTYILSVATDSCYVLLGENGSGKTWCKLGRMTRSGDRAIDLVEIGAVPSAVVQHTSVAEDRMSGSLTPRVLCLYVSQTGGGIYYKRVNDTGTTFTTNIAWVRIGTLTATEAIIGYQSATSFLIIYLDGAVLKAVSVTTATGAILAGPWTVKAASVYRISVQPNEATGKTHVLYWNYDSGTGTYRVGSLQVDGVGNVTNDFNINADGVTFHYLMPWSVSDGTPENSRWICCEYQTGDVAQVLAIRDGRGAVVTRGLSTFSPSIQTFTASKNLWWESAGNGPQISALSYLGDWKGSQLPLGFVPLQLVSVQGANLADTFLSVLA